MRTNGILLALSSLPSKYGIGSFGNESYEFIDLLNVAGIGLLLTVHDSYGANLF